jgi:hypothetical protein
LSLFRSFFAVKESSVFFELVQTAASLRHHLAHRPLPEGQADPAESRYEKEDTSAVRRCQGDKKWAKMGQNDAIQALLSVVDAQDGTPVTGRVVLSPSKAAM